VRQTIVNTLSEELGRYRLQDFKEDNKPESI
jgi:hypothetical protein